MKIGFVGLGKLGLPCAAAISAKGHEVVGYDPKFQHRLNNNNGRLINLDAPKNETGVWNLLQAFPVYSRPLNDICNSDIIFVAVQTPHDPMYGGETFVPSSRKDFDYTHLVRAVEDIVNIKPNAFIVIISTVLPGTVRRYILPIAKDATIVYNPYFIAMGTVVKDFYNPEFVLIGSDDSLALNYLISFYATIHSKPTFCTTIENAELIKVTYNTFIGMKIIFANTVMEICHKTPNTNSDAVYEALKLATDRITSSAYLKGGMGDAGACHPRDNIALSWLARELNLSSNVFDDVMRIRENQTNWLANLIIEQHRKTGLPIQLMGAAYKPETHLIDGSCGLLLKTILEARGYQVRIYDPFVGVLFNKLVSVPPTEPSVFFISTNHARFKTFQFPRGSVVIDPFRMWKYNDVPYKVTYIPIGVGPNAV